MKRWVWLLAVPYVVHVETSTPTMLYQKPSYIYFVGPIDCGFDKTLCEDLADSLNAAHERRECQHPMIQCADETYPKLDMEFYDKDGKKAK